METARDVIFFFVNKIPCCVLPHIPKLKHANKIPNDNITELYCHSVTITNRSVWKDLVIGTVQPNYRLTFRKKITRTPQMNIIIQNQITGLIFQCLCNYDLSNWKLVLGTFQYTRIFNCILPQIKSKLKFKQKLKLTEIRERKEHTPDSPSRRMTTSSFLLCDPATRPAPASISASHGSLTHSLSLFFSDSNAPKIPPDLAQELSSQALNPSEKIRIRAAIPTSEVGISKLHSVSLSLSHLSSLSLLLRWLLIIIRFLLTHPHPGETTSRREKYKGSPLSTDRNECSNKRKG